MFWERKMDQPAVADIVRDDDDDIDDNNDGSVTMLQASTRGTVVQSETDVKALESTEVDIWLL